MKHFMLDIESLALCDRAAIIEVGICLFDITNGRVLATVDSEVNWLSCVRHGGVRENATVKWWREQTNVKMPGAIPENCPDIIPVLDMVADFTKVHNEGDDWCIWANGICFDINVLEFYYKQTGLAVPWTYNQVRDARTIYKLARDVHPGWRWPELSCCDLSHRAGYDVMNQASALSDALWTLDILKP